MADIGGRTVLDCNHDAPPPHVRRTWSRVDGRPLSRYAHPQRNNVLIIQVTTADDAGVYRCAERRPGHGGDVLIVEAEIVVNDIPHISFNPEMPLNVHAGQNVRIYCNVSGTGPLEVRWHAENWRQLPLTVLVSGRWLQFARITPADAGRYYCSAANQYGNSTKTAEVLVGRNEVVSRPTHGGGRDAPQRHDAIEGGTVRLLCKNEQTPEGSLVSGGDFIGSSMDSHCNDVVRSLRERYSVSRKSL